MPTRTTKLAVAAVAAYALYRNIQLELSSVPFELGFTDATFHALLYLFRLIPRVLLQRLFNIRPSLTTKHWYAHEEIAMRAANFAAKIAMFDMPNSFLKNLARQSRFMLTATGQLHVEDVPSAALGFDTPQSTARFGKKTKCTGLWITLDGAIKFSQVEDDVLVLFFTHGGGFCIGNAAMYLAAMTKFLTVLRDEHHITRVGILSIEYPLSPQVKHPIPTDTSFYVYDYLVREQRRIKPENIILAGDSAGGSIALTIALKATRWGAAGACLFSPWVGHDLETNSHVEFEHVDLIGGRLGIEQYQEAHVQGGRELAVRDDTLHVLNKNLPFGQLPAIWINYGEFEVFQDDVRKLASELEANQVKVQLQVGAAAPHVYPMLFPLFMAQGGPAWDDCARFCVEQWAIARVEAERLAHSKHKEEKAKVEKLKRDLSLTDLGELYMLNKSAN